MEDSGKIRDRVEALEQQLAQLNQQTHVLVRQARWWRGIACGLALIGVVSLPLQSGTAANTQPKGMAERMAAVEHTLQALSFDDTTKDVVISGANLRVVNGLGTTDTTNGLGNVIVGYSELRQDLLPACAGATEPFCTDIRTGSHNVVVGRMHNFSRFSGLVVGELNAISGDFATVSGGTGNIASGIGATVSGGINHTASGEAAAVTGGAGNTASGSNATVSGGSQNTASGFSAAVSGGELNSASSLLATVSGGHQNTASNSYASVSGGEQNVASGAASSVSGGANRTAPGQSNWAAGPLFASN